MKKLGIGEKFTIRMKNGVSGGDLNPQPSDPWSDTHRWISKLQAKLPRGQIEDKAAENGSV